MKNEFVSLICQRLKQGMDVFKNEFNTKQQFDVARHFAVDNLLPQEIAQSIYFNFPSKEQMRFMNSFRERKFTYKQLGSTPQILKDITFAIQHPDVIALIEQITEIENQTPDPSLYAGGLSMMVKSHFLNPHIDNSHDGGRKKYRTVNLLYYVSPDWKLEYGGNLELWDQSVQNAIVVPSLFNRLVVMETNTSSWHSVSPVTYDGSRCCVSNYYFSEKSPEGREYFNVTSFSARPEQKIRRILSSLDNMSRECLRKLFRFGLGKKDVYQQ